MSKLADTLRKDGWELTPGEDLKPGDYIATISGYQEEPEGVVSHWIENDNDTLSVFYGERGVVVLPIATSSLWVAPKEYEHLETRWDTDGTKYINISTDPREPIFCLASYIAFKHVFNPDNRDVALCSCKDPESLLKEKPVRSE